MRVGGDFNFGDLVVGEKDKKRGGVLGVVICWEILDFFSKTDGNGGGNHGVGGGC